MSEPILEATDRYGDGPRPDPSTMCEGQCRGLGWMPVHKDDPEEPWKSLVLKAEQLAPSDDGWHSVECPDCKGTGKANV